MHGPVDISGPRLLDVRHISISRRISEGQSGVTSRRSHPPCYATCVRTLQLYLATPCLQPIIDGYRVSADYTAAPRDTAMSKEKVEIKNQLPVVIAEETSVLRISHIRVDFEGIEMVGQVHHGCGQPYGVFGCDLDVFRGSKVK